MTHRICSLLIFGLVGTPAVLAIAADESAQRVALGRQEYLAKCAACHGESGRGEGPRAESLPAMPPDLTTYTRRHGGTFPAQRAAATIDGRGYYDMYRPMPAWGQFYSIEAYSTPVSATPEQYVDDHVAALVAYVARLQVQ